MLVEEAKLKFYGQFMQHGSKRYRKEKFSKISEILNWIEVEYRVQSLGQIGNNHVLGYWKSHRTLSDITSQKYWLAVKDLWVFLKKVGDPPKPYTKDDLIKKVESRTPKINSFSDFGLALRSVMDLSDIPVIGLANATGIEVRELVEIANGRLEPSFVQLNALMNATSIRFTIDY
ncbi:hypothetical protein [Methylomonas sp. AM2-LC]|uniref:hypothetical protein n=1 Tax=Methylomonas sp. AM2-LC TaxID=3153301 RepID=UPI003265DF3A